MEPAQLLSTSGLKLGIISGGQLGKMLIQEASKWDVETYVMDPDERGPSSQIATVFVKGDRFNYDDVYQFGKMVDVLTFEIESINVEALKALKKEGLYIVPDPNILELIQDKGIQKDFYAKHKIPTSPYQLLHDKTALIQAIKDDKIQFPFVQKLRTGGYDGRGVVVINSQSEINQILEGPSVIEPKVSIQKEIAVIVARNAKGETKCFPSVEMIFDPVANLVDNLMCPADITTNQEREAAEIASKLANEMQLQGLLAVEFFIDQNGGVMVNEAAPRPHNSGHHTIESVVTSQYEQHLRAVLNLPLGAVDIMLPAVMVNLLGSPGHDGPVQYNGLEACMGIEGVNVHIYGKKETRPMRKMGHVTIVDQNLENALKKAEEVKNKLKVISWKK